MSLATIFQFLLGLVGLGNKVADKAVKDDQQDAGAARQKAADTGAALDAEQRMDRSEAQPTTTSEDLDRGTF
ncbi:MAG TPA: hypothetical protein VMI56_17070 [Reyranella sp.]|nr:hypothetical protein [Reyranella sp.]